ncbi:MAG: lytic transglycosylase domain-containing protein [Gallionellaceae bacterium]|nr:lytic transglycosylase domain-containing protein [Gallionellaceae bacterium]
MNQRHPVRQPLCIIAMMLGLAICTPGRADIYSYTDESGSVLLSNHITDERASVLLRSPQEAAPVHLASVAEPPVLAAKPYAPLVSEIALQQEMDAALLHAVITVESGHNAQAVSPKGARGLMQLMPATAKRYGVADIDDPGENIRGGARYLKDLMAQFGNDLNLSLAAYNAGENAVIRHGRRIPPYPETRNYVARVLDIYHGFSNPSH